MREGEGVAIAWNSLPYLVVIPLAFVHGWQRRVLAGVMGMLLLDAALFADVLTGAKSSWQLMLSVISSVKLFTVFPFCFLVGIWFDRNFKKAPDQSKVTSSK